MPTLLTAASKLILDTIFPIRCLACKKYCSKYFCDTCIVELPKLLWQRCIVCSKPSVAGFTHPGCLSTICPTNLISIYDYHDKHVSEAIILGKYKYIDDIYNQLGQTMTNELVQNYHFLINEVDIIIPIPLAKSRQRWRGFNQSDILCQKIGALTDIPVLPILCRTKNTKTQKDLPQKERLRNVRNAFSVSSTTDLSGRRILLIDDVCTTGATLLSATKTLKQAGAVKVYCATLASD
jgi:competence protein ComFC